MVRVSSGFVRNNQIVIERPAATPKTNPRAQGGYVIMRTSGLKQAQETAKAIPRRVKQSLEVHAEERAGRLQATLQAALTAEYSKSGTGRFARSIKVRVVKGTGRGGGPSTSLQIYQSQTYRENRFLTNLGNFKGFTFPYGPYRIYAKGAQALADMSASEFGSGRVLARHIRKAGGTARLKVPRSGRFFTAGRKPGRGGGESRFINDALGPMEPGDRLGSFFFYPLWVTHPGFRRDLLSEIAIREGSQYTREVVGGVSEVLAAGIIPVGETRVRQTESGSERHSVAIPVYLKSVR